MTMSRARKVKATARREIERLETRAKAIRDAMPYLAAYDGDYDAAIEFANTVYIAEHKSADEGMPEGYDGFFYSLNGHFASPYRHDDWSLSGCAKDDVQGPFVSYEAAVNDIVNGLYAAKADGPLTCRERGD